MKNFLSFFGWVVIIVLTMYLSTIAFNFINADNSIESLLGLLILILIGGVWFTISIKGVKICYDYLKDYLE